MFAVLWNATTGQVLVGHEPDRSFADQTAMKDYKVNFDVGYFGTDNPATAVAGRVPFVVQTDGKNKYVNLGIVAGAARLARRRHRRRQPAVRRNMSGAAPGAKIVSSRACLFVAGCTGHALLEGMIYVAKQKNVDVINMSIGGLPALNDGNNTRCVLYDRLIEQSNVQMFISPGNNGPGVNTAGDPGCLREGARARRVHHVRHVRSATTARRCRSPDNIHYFSSRGPREDGGFSPELVAPGAAVSSTPMWQPAVRRGRYTLPPGYSLLNGTSMAAPQATGVGALLISAAKQAGVAAAAGPDPSGAHLVRPVPRPRRGSRRTTRAWASSTSRRPGTC